MNGRTLSRAIQRSRPRTAAATSSTTTRGESGTNRGGVAVDGGPKEGWRWEGDRGVAGRGPRQRPRRWGRCGTGGVVHRAADYQTWTPARARTRGDPRAASALAAHARARSGCSPAGGSRAERGVGGGARGRGTAAGARRPAPEAEGPGRLRGAAPGRDGGRGRADGRAPVRSMAGLAGPRGADRRDAARLVADGPRGRVARRARARGRGVRGRLPDRAWRGGATRRRSRRPPNGSSARRSLFRTRDKGGSSVRYDLRPLLESIEVVAGSPVVLRVRTRFDPQLGNGRPEEVVAALADEVGQDLVIDEIVRERSS